MYTKEMQFVFLCKCLITCGKTLVLLKATGLEFKKQSLNAHQLIKIP